MIFCPNNISKDRSLICGCTAEALQVPVAPSGAFPGFMAVTPWQAHEKLFVDAQHSPKTIPEWVTLFACHCKTLESDAKGTVDLRSLVYSLGQAGGA